MVVGCGTDRDPGPGVGAGARLSLVAADPRDDWAPVGVAFDAASDRLYVLDASQGIVVLDAEGALVERIEIDNQWGVPLTDLAITGETISVLSDYAGYRLDRAAGSLEEYFCLEPGFEPDPQDPEPEPCTYHQSGGLTFIGGDDVVVAAPYHLDCTTNEPVRTVIESFDTTTGTVASQIALARPVLYGGLAWDADESRYLAGSAEGIVAIDPVSGRTSDAGIDTADVSDIQGLALDAARRRLWVVDAAARELVRFDLQ
jgi:hypothetical protein